MAERRMFAKTIIDSDAFLDMPHSTQLLYFHLSMRADDDGFINNPKKIQRTVGCGDDDIKLLIAKSFIIPFESGVVVIKHWRIHNFIRTDRYKETVYQEEKAMLNTKDNKAYTLNSEAGIPLGIPDDNQMETQVRLGKDRLGKDRLGKDRLNYQLIADLYNEICTSFPRLTVLSDKRKQSIRARFKTYTVEQFKEMFEKAEASDFLKGANNKNWQANFDWMMKDANFAKILDGNYNNKPKQTEQQGESTGNFFIDMMIEEGYGDG